MSITALLLRRGDLASANGCWRRSANRRHCAHLSAPTGTSVCDFCGRIVLRGMGRWWA